jgi:hypothetical protein
MLIPDGLFQQGRRRPKRRQGSDAHTRRPGSNSVTVLYRVYVASTPQRERERERERESRWTKARKHPMATKPYPSRLQSNNTPGNSSHKAEQTRALCVHSLCRMGPPWSKGIHKPLTGTFLSVPTGCHSTTSSHLGPSFVPGSSCGTPVSCGKGRQLGNSVFVREQTRIKAQTRTMEPLRGQSSLPRCTFWPWRGSRRQNIPEQDCATRVNERNSTTILAPRVIITAFERSAPSAAA